MIKTDEGLGGWTIRVINGGKTTRFECAQYIVKRGGINWFDWDRAMRDAEKLDAAQHGVQPTAPVAKRKSAKSTSRKSSTVRGG